MASQLIPIVDTLDDGYQSGSTFPTDFYLFGDANPGGASFVVTTEIPALSTIDNCYIRAHSLTTNSGNGQPKVAIENADPASNTRFSASHLPGSATIYTGDTHGSTINFVDYLSRDLFGPGDDIPLDLTADMQSLVDDYGTIAVNDRINVVTLSVAGTGFLHFEDLTVGGGNEAELYIEWTAGGGGGAQLSSRGIIHLQM